MSPSLIEPGKPHIFLLSTRQREKDHISSSTKTPDAIAEYGDIIDALFEVVERKELSEACLAMLREKMTSRFKVVYEQAGRRLVQLSHYFEPAGDVLLSLLSSSKSSIRVRVVQALWNDVPPPDLTDKIIRNALLDNSSSVRSFAASRVGQLKLYRLIPDLKSLRGTEENEKVLVEIDYALKELNKAMRGSTNNSR